MGSVIEQKLAEVAWLYRAGEYRAALAVGLPLLDVIASQYGKNHFYYTTITTNLAVINKYLGDFSKAAEFFRQSLYSAELAGEDTEIYRIVLGNYAEFVAARGNPAEALPMIERCLRLEQKLRGVAHTDVATALNNLGSCCTALGEMDRAEQCHEEALKIDQAVLGENHPNYASDLCKIAEIRMRRCDFSTARLLLEQAIEIRRRTIGPRHPEFVFGLRTRFSRWFANRSRRRRKR